MKLLGILGGMGPQATVHFYDLIVKESARRKCGQMRNADFPHILINNIPVPDLVQRRDNEEQTVRMVEDEARRLVRAGCTHLAMPCNTMHLFADRIQKAADRLPFISMVDAVVERLEQNGVRSVGLLGSVTTMKSKLYSEPLEARGIRVVVPSPEDREIIGRLIHTVIAGTIRSDHCEKFRRIVASLAQKTDIVLLGCTELPILKKKSRIPNKISIIDSPLILAEKCCEVLYGGRRQT